MFPSSVACRSCCSLVCCDPSPYLHLICHVTTYDLPRKVLFAPFLFSTSVPSTILRRRFNLFLTACYWASHTDIDLSSFQPLPQPVDFWTTSRKVIDIQIQCLNVRFRGPTRQVQAPRNTLVRRHLISFTVRSILPGCANLFHAASSRSFNYLYSRRHDSLLEELAAAESPASHFIYPRSRTHELDLVSI